jgi:PAS domain S-box-containing protein
VASGRAVEVREAVVAGRRSSYSRRVATAADFLAQILEDAPQPVWVVDEQGLIVFANPAAVRALGYDGPAQLYHRPSHATVHHRRPDGSPYPENECPMLKPRQTGETVHGEDWFVRRDGSMFPIAWWSAPIAMANGNGAVLAFNDVTERRAAEQAERDRDAAEIHAAELRASQRRIVENSALVRRQVVRDLHDGAQQRLITMLISLQLAREEAETDPAEARRLLDDAIGQAQTAVGELRELAAGLHPPILVFRGLVAAVEELAARAALPVVVSGSLPGRLPEAVETNAYFFVAEALTNTAKHARAVRAEVRIAADDLTLSIEVRDDGVGGAVVDGRGSGLAGLADRVGALGGRMRIVSPHGRGTTLRAEIPVEQAPD